MYDDPKYSKLRDTAFMIFYMGINAGAFFAPFAATGIRNWWLKINGFLHDGSLPAICHQFQNGTINNFAELQVLADKASLNGPVTDLTGFAKSYLDVFSRGYNYAFGIAAGAMILSLLVYLFFGKLLPKKEKVTKEKASSSREKPWSIIVASGVTGIVGYLLSLVLDSFATGLAFGLFAGFVVWIIINSTKEELPRTSSLILVFLVVIFFWMSFHQNGLTLTFFARDYTVKTVGPFTYLFFTFKNILSVIAFIAGIILVSGRKNSRNSRLAGTALLIAGGIACYYFYNQAASQNSISPETFQSFNPLFIVSLTFVVMAFFEWLNKKGIELSTPRKIGFGMIIAAAGFAIVLVASLNLVSPDSLKFIDETGAIKYNPVPDSSRVMPYWLISSYLILTIAELFLSPMGLSFVSKVAPPRFQGLMQGGWLLAAAVGNKLLFIGSTFWGRLELWQLWLIFITVCLLSAAFIFLIMKRLERVTK
jgi:POT family proton-dependent oligopeptide transporter